VCLLFPCSNINKFLIGRITDLHVTLPVTSNCSTAPVTISQHPPPPPSTPLCRPVHSGSSYTSSSSCSPSPWASPLSSPWVASSAPPGTQSPESTQRLMWYSASSFGISVTTFCSSPMSFFSKHSFMTWWGEIYEKH